MKRTILTNTNLIDGISAKPLSNFMIVVEGKRIIWVGPKEAWSCEPEPRDQVLGLQVPAFCQACETCA